MFPDVIQTHDSNLLPPPAPVTDLGSKIRSQDLWVVKA
jgi:hypothetical protein